jgi:VWFA-related protein
MILLSDGDDTGSSIPYRDALEYARRSGVSIYSVGLNVGKLSVGIRRKLTSLSEETGGRVFFIGQAEELVGVYDEIEEELRSQYLLAYTSDKPKTDDAYREVEVKVKKGGVKARTIRGYYP